MYRIKGEHYYDDYTRQTFEKTFTSLEEIFTWMLKTSENFTSDYGNYFPHIEQNIDRISTRDENNRGYEYWIYQIENENSIVFSTGRYTSGNKFCATRIREWCDEGNQRIRKIKTKPNFVEC